MGRFARSVMARASGGTVALSRLWPGRTDRLIIAPHDLRTADATRAAEIYAGRFVFAGKIVTCHGRSIFDLEPPSEDWEVALLGFGWLRHLRAADTALTRANARSLVDDWISNPTRKRPLERRADVMARRVISLLSQAPLVLGDTDGKFYRRYLRGLTREIRYLRYAMLDIADGVPRLQVLVALCYASLCLANQAKHIRSATRKLSDELQRQILPDGGHISRNPGALVELLSDLLPLRQTFAARNIAPPPALLNAIDRMMPMLRFFRHGDGSFALFNGMSNAPNDLVATLLAYDDTHGVPMANMPHTGFQRLDAGAMTVDHGHRRAAAAERQPRCACRMPVVRTVVRAEPHRDQLRHAVDRPRQLARLCARHGGAFDADLSRHLVLPVRRIVGDEEIAAGLADRLRPRQCRELSRGGAERRAADHIA